MGVHKVALVTSVARATAITAIVLRYSHYIPRSLRWIIVFLTALNIRNFPLAWHVRILKPWFAWTWRLALLGKYVSKKARLRQLTWDARRSLGKSPFDPNMTYVYKSTAAIADCDYNGHLSNSSYAKILDQVRMESYLAFFPGSAITGIQMILGGGYFHFVREIPLHRRFEIRFGIGGWDEKWIYLTSAFVSYPSSSSSKKGHREKKVVENGKAIANGNGVNGMHKEANGNSVGVGHKGKCHDETPLGESIVVVPPLSEEVLPTPPELVLNFTSASSSTLDLPLESGISSSGSSTPASKPLGVPAPIPLSLPEGAVLHATAISQYCFKHGRITVPPRVSLTLAGFGTPTTSEARWDSLMLIREDKPHIMKNIIRGGWKNEEDGGDPRLGPGFWDFEEFDEEGRRRGEALRMGRFVLEGLAGK